MDRPMYGYITLWILVATFVASGVWYAIAPVVSVAEYEPTHEQEITSQPLFPGKFVVVHLDTMFLDLRDGTTTIATFPIVSKGKPGSYFETIGGVYENDYNIPLHFSSIGHVYMPYSVHVFGNFFIHGIPYYPNGTKVSSTYSGGCVRLYDKDAKQVYDFVSKGTPIVLTQSSEYAFTPTVTSTPTVESLEMTQLMVGTISLELLTQDNVIADLDGGATTTRRALLGRLLSGDTGVNESYARYLGKNTFVMYMNQKAKSLGLTNTTFSDETHAAMTTPEDLDRFLTYIRDYKSYLLSVNN